MRKIVLMLTLAVGAFAAVPAQAAGFLQDLFERFDRPAPVMYRYAPPQPQLRFYQADAPRLARRAMRAPVRESRPLLRNRLLGARQIPIRNLGPRTATRTAARVKVAALTPESVKAVVPPCCAPDVKATVSIGTDKTLRVGDALMTSKGLRVYRGGAAEGAFIDYRKADLHQEAKYRLGALEQGASAEGGTTSVAPKLAVTKHVTAETAALRTSLDKTGRVIRVVGP